MICLYSTHPKTRNFKKNYSNFSDKNTFLLKFMCTSRQSSPNMHINHLWVVKCYNMSLPTPSFAHNWLTIITGTILYHMHSNVRRRIRSSTRLCHITINIRMCNPLETGYTFVCLSQYSSSNTRCVTSILHCVSVPFIDN